MESMNKKWYQELKALSGGNQKIHDFLVQIMDDSGQLGERATRNKLSDIEEGKERLNELFVLGGKM